MIEKGKVKRSKVAHFLNIGSKETPEFARMGKGISDLSVDYNPDTEEFQWIDQDNGTTEINSYAPSHSTEQVAYAGDDVFDYVDDLRIKRGVGAEAQTQELIVYLYRKTADGGYEAELNNCAISIESFGGDKTAKINYNVGFDGDPIHGTVKIDAAGKITFTPNAEGTAPAQQSAATKTTTAK